MFSTTTESGGLTIRAYQEKGTLRDAVCKCKPKNHYLKKYASPKSCSTLELNAVKIVGKQILEALKFLHEKGLPYGKIINKIWFITRYQFNSIWQLVGIELLEPWTTFLIYMDGTCYWLITISNSYHLARKIVFYKNPLKFFNERDYPDNVKHLSESWFDTTLSVQCTVFSVFKVIYMREMW